MIHRALLLAAVAACGPTTAAPVADALDRPALASRDAAGAVLLGAAQAGSRVVAVGERGIVVLSDDGGQHWRQAGSVPVSVTLTSVRFADDTHGYAVGHGGTVLSTDDAGTTWTRRLDGRRAAELAVKEAQSRDDAAALKAARLLVTDGPDKPFLDVLAIDAQHALAVGAYGLAYGTADGGRTWAPWTARLDNPKGLHLYAVRARGQRIVIAGEQGLVLKSDDGGRTFARVATPYGGSWFTAELPSDTEIVLAGLRGNVWRSTDGGAQWAALKLPAPVSVTGSALRADGAVVLADQSGKLLTAQGDAVAALPAPALPPLNAVLLQRDGAVLAFSVRGAANLGKAP